MTYMMYMIYDISDRHTVTMSRRSKTAAKTDSSTVSSRSSSDIAASTSSFCCSS